MNGRQAWNLGKRRGGLKVRRSSQRPSVSGSQPLLVLGPMATTTRQGIRAKPPRVSVPRPPRIREAFKPKPHLPSLESRVSCTCPQAIPFLCIYACINDMKEGRNRSDTPYHFEYASPHENSSRSGTTDYARTCNHNTPILVSSSVENLPDPRRTTTRPTPSLWSPMEIRKSPDICPCLHDHISSSGSYIINPATVL